MNMSDDIEDIALAINMSLHLQLAYDERLVWKVWMNTVAHTGEQESGQFLNRTNVCFLYH